MQRFLILSFVSLLFLSVASESRGQSKSTWETVRFERRNLSGPRFGMTYVSGNGPLYRELQSRGMGRTLSQFGWHFERQVIPEGGGPQLVVQAVPLVAGVEYGKFIPSATLALGVRFTNGFELGLGPNLMVLGSDAEDPVDTALVVAAGKSIDYGGVSIPLNVAFATNPEGNRISLILGYAISRARKH